VTILISMQKWGLFMHNAAHTVTSRQHTVALEVLRFVSVLLVLFGLIPTLAQGQSRGDEYLRVSFIDVGQGDAIWIQTPAQADGTPGKNILIDGGPDRGAKNRVLQYLRTYGLAPGSVIDCIVVTHPHTDHYPGLLDVLAQYEVKTIIDSGFPKEGPRFAAFVSAAQQETIKGKPSAFIKLRDQPATTLAWGDVTATILYADSDREDMGRENTRENNASIVIKISYGDFSFLFMGDAEGEARGADGTTARFVEQALLTKYKTQPDVLQATVLKAGHHGSETGSTEPFLRAVSPDVIVIMSGRKAFSGTYLPDASVLKRYERVLPKATIIRTDQDDARERRDTTTDADGDDIYLYTDGETLLVYQAQGPDGRRRWKKVQTLQR
jgi:competence protein ComEC